MVKEERGRSFAVAGTEAEGRPRLGSEGAGPRLHQPEEEGPAPRLSQPRVPTARGLWPPRVQTLASAHAGPGCQVVHLPASGCFSLHLFTLRGLCRCPQSLPFFFLPPFPQSCSFSWALVSETRGPAPAFKLCQERDEEPGFCAGKRDWETGEPRKSGAL